MKTIIYGIILTLLVTCGSVLGNPAIEALRSEIQQMEENIDINDFERHWKLNHILEEMVLREQNKELLEQWEADQKDVPCDSIHKDGWFCKKVRI